jgi:hypothetical protein
MLVCVLVGPGSLSSLLAAAAAAATQ